MPRRLLLLFIDGVGIGPSDPVRNPIAAARLDTFSNLLGGARLLQEDLGSHGVESAGASLRPLDATLGVEGTPQSGTGQTALLTGRNAPQLFGRHFGPWVPTLLRPMLASESIFARARGAGLEVAFANAYPAGHLATDLHRVRRPGAFPYALRGAGLSPRDERDVRAGEALTAEITNDAWIRHVDPHAPRIGAREAGRILARIATGYDLTIFAHYDTDHIAHRGTPAEAVAAIERVDTFLEGILTELDSDTLLLLTSDHGNLEEQGTRHTRNQVPLLAAGRGGARLTRGVHSIAEVMPRMLKLLDRREGTPWRVGAGR